MSDIDLTCKIEMIEKLKTIFFTIFQLSINVITVHLLFKKLYTVGLTRNHYNFYRTIKLEFIILLTTVPQK